VLRGVDGLSCALGREVTDKEADRLARGRGAGIYPIEEVAFSQDGERFGVDGHIGGTPAADGLRHTAQRLARGDVVLVPAAVKNQGGCYEE
jgi:hypothetical protein